MKKISVIVLMLILVISVGLVSAGPNDLPGNGWLSGQQIQNVGPANGTVNLMAYDQAGNSYNCGDQNLDPGESYTYLPANDCATMPAGFEGSAVASADQPIAATVNVVNKPVGQAAAQYNGTDGGDISTTIAFPLVKNNHSGRTTTFYIQNASSSPNNITAVFSIQGTDYTNSYNAVPANAMVIVNPSDAGVPTGTGVGIGALTVTGTQPIAGTSLEHENAPVVANNLQGSRAFVPSDYGNTLYCPLVRYLWASRQTSTGVQVQNVGNVPTNITLSYDVSVGTANNPSVTALNVQPGASVNFLQQDDLAPNTLAAATITSSATDIAALVNDKAFATSPQRVTSYACFNESNASDTVSLPLVKDNFNGNNAGIQIQNVGGSPTDVTLTYKTGAGSTVVIETTAPIAAGASKTFLDISTGGTSGINVVSGNVGNLNDTVSGVVIVSSGQPIVAIVNEVSLPSNPQPQDTKNYEGFNQ